MPNILAIDTATDVCSVGFQCGASVNCISENIPRQHSRRLFGMLSELLPNGLREHGVELLAYNHGPGSFTGLRIAASAVQGLAFSNGLPVAGISTLACLAEGARRRAEVAPGEVALVLLDARLDEVYWGSYAIEEDGIRPLGADAVCPAADIPVPATPVVAVGSGQQYRTAFVDGVEEKILRCPSPAWPDVLDLLALAGRSWQEGQRLSAQQAIPVYLHDASGWSKLAPQEPR